MRRIGIIGAGACGLAAAKAVLQEGMLPIVFEGAHRLGGVCGPDVDTAVLSAAWPGMRLNISRHNGVFKDFPWPANSPDFPVTQQVYDYLCAYAQRFQLEFYIHFHSRVIAITQQAEQWLIKIEREGQTSQYKVDAIIIACGRHHQPFIPTFPGLDKVTANIEHSATYRRSNHYAGQKVLVVGGSYSGTAIAEEIAHSTTVTHLFSKPRWVVKHYRTLPGTAAVMPRDISQTYAQSRVKKSEAERYQLLVDICAAQMDCPAWRMNPDSEPGAAVAEDYFALVANKKIIPCRGEIEHFTKTSVVLRGDEEYHFDRIVFCTGYGLNLNFLPEHLRELKLYEDTFLPENPTCAFVGLWKGSRGAVFPLAELQAEWICGVLSKRLSLPATVEMQAQAHTPREQDGVEFAEALAKHNGSLPEIEKFAAHVQDLLLHGFTAPARYLLVGEHSNYQLAVQLLEEAKQYRDNLITKPKVEMS
jgi:dimethylaniline monooxygenase (N-oxide forming)